MVRVFFWLCVYDAHGGHVRVIDIEGVDELTSGTQPHDWRSRNSVCVCVNLFVHAGGWHH